MRLRRTLPFIFVLASFASCAWLKSNEVALSEDQIQAVGCVLSAVAGGVPVEAVAVLACGITDIVKIVELADAAHITPVPSPGLTAVRSLQALQDASTDTTK